MEVSGIGSCTETGSEDPTRDGFVEAAMEVSRIGSCTETGSEDPTRDGSCVVLVEDVKKLGSLVEQELGKVSLIEGCEVLDVFHMDFPAIPEFVDIEAENGLKSVEVIEDDDRLKGKEIVVEKIGLEGSKLGSDVSIERESGSDGDESDSSSESESESDSSSSSSSSGSGDEETSSSEEEGVAAVATKEDVVAVEEEEDVVDKGEEEVATATIEKDDVLVKGEGEEEEEEGEGDVEEGEIRGFDEEEMVEFSEDEDGGGVMKGPIRSKHELEKLPPVPPVDATLEPHHQTLPVGVVLSIVGAKVIIEGVEKHNPLNEGSILWITETRSPLGLVDEIFGPVKNPYYVVRYNSDDEVPDGIHEGTSVSFVAEFANHILNDSSLYKKGYDASNENDEELSDDAEFSDDEKEAEYKRMLKMKKRGVSVNDQKPVNKMKGKKGNNRDMNWKKGQQNQNYSGGPDSGNGFSGGPGPAMPGPQFQPVPQAAGFAPQQNTVWPNGVPYMQQQQQGMVFPNAMVPDGRPWMHQNQFPMHFPNGMPFQPQFDPSQMGFPIVMLPPGQPNTFGGPVGPWAQPMFGMGFPNVAQQGVQFNSLGLQQQNMGLQPGPALIPGNFEASRQYNDGTSSGRGRNAHRRGGGHFGGGRGRHQPK